MGPLSAKEKQTALKEWIKSCQTLHYENRHTSICKEVNCYDVVSPVRRLLVPPFKAPDHAPLPRIRVEERTPFAVTGVDFAGPLYVRTQLGEAKIYICLFTCAVTRGIHLEIVSDLPEEKFLLAFRRFSSRKSLPLIMISDNAFTYLASAETLKELFESPSLHETFSRQEVQWKFIPKRAPRYGFFWERLKKTFGRASITCTRRTPDPHR